MGHYTSATHMTNTENAILVTNLDQNVEKKQLSDFFSFCGRITSLTVRRKDDDAEAILFFESEAAAKTALLLTNALINDRPIIVQAYTEQKQQEHVEENQQIREDKEQGVEPTVFVSEMPKDDITQRPATSNHRSATATLASLVAGGYILGVDALERARRIDQENNISRSVSQGATQLKERARGLDEQYKVSETAETTSRAMGEQWNSVDQRYGVGETVGNWGSNLATGFSNMWQNPTVQSTLSTVSEWTNTVGRSLGAAIQPAADSVSREFNEIKEQSAREIELKRKEREEANKGVEMEELGDEFNKAEPPVEPIPAPDLDKIPPPPEPEENIEA